MLRGPIIGHVKKRGGHDQQQQQPAQTPPIPAADKHHDPDHAKRDKEPDAFTGERLEVADEVLPEIVPAKAGLLVGQGIAGSPERPECQLIADQ